MSARRPRQGEPGTFRVVEVTDSEAREDPETSETPEPSGSAPRRPRAPSADYRATFRRTSAHGSIASLPDVPPA